MGDEVDLLIGACFAEKLFKFFGALGNAGTLGETGAFGTWAYTAP